MNAKQKRNLARIITAVALMIALHFLPAEGATRFLCYMAPYLVVGYDVLFKALRGIWKRLPFDENLLMTIATLGAVALAVSSGDGDYDEAVEVMLLYQIGEWFQSIAVGRSRRNISELMDVCPDYAEIESASGEIEKVDPDDVEIGTTIVVRPGERVPIDGVVTDGVSTLNLAALTGESRPKEVEPGDQIVSGSINLVGVLRVKTTKEFGESTASKILELIEDAGVKKSRSEDFITKFARIYTPIVVFAALALAVLPPVALALCGAAPRWNVWIYRALTFLIVSCPCALVISIPLSFFAGIGCASRRGVLVKGSPYIEALAKIKTVVFDKTGTLTKGVFEVVAVHPEEFDETELLHLTAHVERYSTHPIAVALRAAYLREKDGCSVERAEEFPGRGVKAIVNGKAVYVGNAKLMEEVGAKWRDECHRKSGVVVHVAEQGRYLGHVVVSDVVKPSAKETIASLRRLGVRKTVMFTGDGRDARRTARSRAAAKRDARVRRRRHERRAGHHARRRRRRDGRDRFRRRDRGRRRRPHGRRPAEARDRNKNLAKMHKNRQRERLVHDRRQAPLPRARRRRTRDDGHGDLRRRRRHDPRRAKLDPRDDRDVGTSRLTPAKRGLIRIRGRGLRDR